MNREKDGESAQVPAVAPAARGARDHAASLDDDGIEGIDLESMVDVEEAALNALPELDPEGEPEAEAEPEIFELDSIEVLDDETVPVAMRAARMPAPPAVPGRPPGLP